MKYNSSKPIFFNNKKIIEIKNKSNCLLLTWVINNICTNHCTYCPANLHTGSNHHYDWSIVEPFIRECFSRFGRIQCNLSGGEPTVSPFFKDLVNLIYELGGTTNVTTNLVRKKEYWIDIAEKICSVSASYHPEFMETEEKEQDMIDKILFLSEKTRVTIRVMMLPNLWDQCYRFYKKLEKVNDSFSMEMVRILSNFGIGNNFCVINYSDEQEEVLKNSKPLIKFKPLPFNFRHNFSISNIKYDNGIEEILNFEIASSLSNNNNTNFQGWNCSIGLESLFVHYDGSVQRGNCGQGGVIGNINSKIEWPNETIICNKNICHCLADVLISKKIIH